MQHARLRINARGLAALHQTSLFFRLTENDFLELVWGWCDVRILIDKSKGQAAPHMQWRELDPATKIAERKQLPHYGGNKRRTVTTYEKTIRSSMNRVLVSRLRRPERTPA